jgi:hypothetical protein
MFPALSAGTTRPIDQILNQRAEQSGLTVSGSRRFSAHSLSVGGAQDLTAGGSSMPEVMQAGRWSSQAMPARYAERLFASQSGAVRFRERRPVRAVTTRSIHRRDAIPDVGSWAGHLGLVCVIGKGSVMQFRQGDVLLEFVGSVPEGILATPVPSRGPLLVAPGRDGTRSHVVVSGTGLAAWSLAGVPGALPDYLLVGRDGARLVHEQHPPIDLVPGKYRVIRQHEFDPALSAVRPAGD